MLFLCYPKCSTCKKAQTWLEDQGLDYQLRDIKTQNPTQEELRQWHAQSGLPLKRFFNTSGQQYRALGLRRHAGKAAHSPGRGQGAGGLPAGRVGSRPAVKKARKCPVS